MAIQSQIDRRGARYCSRACHRLSGIRGTEKRVRDNIGRGVTCWPWLGSHQPNGYGQIRIGGRNQRAHRLAWEAASGAAIPHGMVVLHTCDNPGCVRNDEIGTYMVNGNLLLRFGHLALGTLADNNADKRTKGRSAAGATHGMRLHPERIALGERNGQARLTAPAVLDMRRRYAAGGVSERALAAEVGVAAATVHRALHGQTWAHLELSPQYH